MHAPLLSQAVAPQVASVVSHAAVQQLPLPEMPQTPEVQASFCVQALPSVSTARQVPPEHQKPLMQSVDAAQLVRQVAASAQLRLPAQAIGVRATQVPAVPQTLPVRMPALQTDVPHIMPTG